MEKEYVINKARRFCGYIVGFVFYISGVLKLLDPVGAGLVMDEYFSFLHLGFLSFSSKTAGTLLALAESLIGAALITGVWRRITSRAAIIFQGFFTFITLLLVIFNPEMDCGCFGEAIHLTHWQTFLKNIILLGLLAIYTASPRLPSIRRPRKYVSFTIVAASTTAFMIYSLVYIPLVDFTDFKPTARIADAYQSDEEDMYEAIFTYEKDGKQEQFTLDNLPDSTWTFVSTETVAKNGKEENTVNISVSDTEGAYQDHLLSTGKVMAVSVYRPQMNQDRWRRIADFIGNASNEGFNVLILTPELPSDVLTYVPEDIVNVLKPHLYHSDYKTLVSMNRSNGGITFFSDGYLIRKWSAVNTPDKEELHEAAAISETEMLIGRSSQGSLIMQSFLLYVFAVMLLL